MKLTNLECAGVRGLADGIFKLSDGSGAPLPIAVVTGPPGAGLTTFLDAIAFSAARMSTGGFVPDAADVLRAGASAATLRSTWLVTPEEQAFGGMAEEITTAEVTFRRGALGRVEADPGLLGLMSRYDHQPTMAKVAYLPARRLTDGAVAPFGNFESEMRSGRLQPSPNKLAGLARALVQPLVMSGDRSRFEQAQALFAEVCATVKLVGVGSTGEPELSLRSGARLPLSRLSFSERNLFVLAAAFVVMGLQRSVVLLDTPELGLAPDQGARALAALRAFATDAQIVVASRDPAILSSVGEGAVVRLGGGRP